MMLNPVEVARQFLYVREAQTVGQNRGLRVEAVQHWSGGQSGDSWCMEFVWMVLDICCQGAPPFARTQAVEVVHQLAIKNGWIVDEPEPGDLVLSVNAANHAHHIGFCTETNPLTTIAGNTSEDGVSSNGDRVAEHAVSPKGKIYVRYPRAA